MAFAGTSPGRRIARYRWLALPLVAGLLLAACSSAPAQSKSVDGTEIQDLPTAPNGTAHIGSPDLSTVAGQRLFLQQVFDDIQGTWKDDFFNAGDKYVTANLRIFESTVRTACGVESANVGPFYCPGDRTVYLDIDFFTAMEAKYGLTGDFAEAYVVAHEMGHHIQNLVGISGRVASLQQTTPSSSNGLSVRVELQADCLAGVWAHTAYQRTLLEKGDIQEALQAAQVVGDDFLQQANGVKVDPDSWTHGSSAQRQKWFTTGYEKGKPSACNTFTGG